MIGAATAIAIPIAGMTDFVVVRSMSVKKWVSNSSYRQHDKLQHISCICGTHNLRVSKVRRCEIVAIFLGFKVATHPTGTRFA